MKQWVNATKTCHQRVIHLEEQQYIWNSVTQGSSEGLNQGNICLISISC